MSSEQFALRILRESYNPLIGRREIVFEISGYSGTPSRLYVRQKLSELLKIDLDKVVVRRLLSPYGINITRGEANIYNSSERAKEIEPRYVLNRNAPAREQK